MTAEADSTPAISPAGTTARFAQLVNDEVEVTLRSKASVIGKLIKITSEEKGLLLEGAITTNVDGSTSSSDQVIISGKDVVTMSSRRVADKFRQSQRKSTPGIAIGGGEEQAQPLVTEMKGVNALNLEPALPKLDEKARSEWIATKEQQSAASVTAINVSNLQREFQSSLTTIDNRNATQARPAANDARSQTRSRQKVNNAPVPQQRSRYETDSRNADPEFAFNPHASTFTPNSNTGGKQAEAGGGRKGERSNRDKTRATEPAPVLTAFQPLEPKGESTKFETLSHFMTHAVDTVSKMKEGKNDGKDWQEAKGPEMLRTFGEPTASYQQVCAELNRVRQHWQEKHGGSFPPQVMGMAFPPGAQAPAGAMPMMAQGHPGGVPLVPMVANPMGTQQLVAMGGQQHGQPPGPKAPSQQHQAMNQGHHGVPPPPPATAQQHNMSPQPDGSGQPPPQQHGMMGAMHMVPVQPGGQMMPGGMAPMMPGMPQGMGMGPNPMQGMQSGQTPPQGQNQAAGAYPQSQGMQQGMQMMPQGMQGMDGQMPANPQMQQQQFMYVQMNPNMMQQMQMAQMQGNSQQMMMPVPMGGMQMQQGQSGPQVDGNNGQQMGGYAPYNMGMPMMGGQQQPGN